MLQYTTTSNLHLMKQRHYPLRPCHLTRVASRGAPARAPRRRSWDFIKNPGQKLVWFNDLPQAKKLLFLYIKNSMKILRLRLASDFWPPKESRADVLSSDNGSDIAWFITTFSLSLTSGTTASFRRMYKITITSDLLPSQFLMFKFGNRAKLATANVLHEFFSNYRQYAVTRKNPMHNILLVFICMSLDSSCMHKCKLLGLKVLI